MKFKFTKSLSRIDVEILYRIPSLVRQQQSSEFASAIINVDTWGYGVRVCVCVCGYVGLWVFVWACVCKGVCIGYLCVWLCVWSCV